MMTGLLDAGWPVPLLLEVTTRPLPEPLRTTVGAVISGSLKAAVSMPVPGSAAGAAVVPRQAHGPGRAHRRRGAAGTTHLREPRPRGPSWSRSTTRSGAAPTSPPYARPTAVSARPSAVVGETLCPLHLDWPLCPGIDGYICTIHTRNGDRCATCRDQARYARLDAVLPVTATDDGTCPGHTGPCGRAALPGDPLCARCLVASQRDRDRILREWEAIRDAGRGGGQGRRGPREGPSVFAGQFWPHSAELFWPHF